MTIASYSREVVAVAAAGEVPLKDDDSTLWLSFKKVWKKLRFSLVHHKRINTEFKDEFY